MAFATEPLAKRFMPEEQVGVWRVYDAAGGFRTVDALPNGTTGPATLSVDLSLPAPDLPPAGRPMILSVLSNGTPVLEQPVNFAGAILRDTNPQTPERSFVITAGTIPAGTAGPLRITLVEGDVGLPASATADLELRSVGFPFAAQAQPAGFALMAIGFIGTVLAWTRRRAKASGTPPVEPATRWGRGGGEA